MTDAQKELNKKLEEGVQAVFNSDSWKNYLKMYENFRNYSWQNKILVMLQKPDATVVKGFRSWQKDFNRTVKKGEKGIRIFAPSTYNKLYTPDAFELLCEYDKQFEKYRNNKQGDMIAVPMQTFVPVSVFDVSQTEGEPLPVHEIRKELKGEVKDYQKTLQMLIDICPCPVDFSNIETDKHLDNAYGYFSPTDNHIVLRDDMSEEMTIKVLVHEMAHSMLHGKDMLVEGIEDTSFLGKKDLKEIQAESVAYCVCDSLGIDSACESFGYIAMYANEDMKKLKNTLDVIDKAVSKIEKGIEEYRDKEKEQTR